MQRYLQTKKKVQKKKKRIEGIKYKQNVFIREKTEQQGKKQTKHHNILSTDTRKTQWNNNNNNHNPSNQSSKR